MNVREFTAKPTYNALVDAIKTYINRYDEGTLNMIPLFINNAEKTILRTMRMPSMESIVKFKLLNANLAEEGEPPYIQIPSDYLEMKFMWCKKETLRRVTFDQILDYNFDKSEEKVWAINADRLYLNGFGEEDEVYMTYYADVPEINEETESNVLLELLPDAFLFLAVYEGFDYLMEHKNASYWESKANKRMNEVKIQIEEAEFSGSPLVVRGNY